MFHSLSKLYREANTLALSFSGDLAMALGKYWEAAAGTRQTRALRAQTPYHSDLSKEYLDGLQRKVDASKPKDFALTPLSEPGW